MLEAEFFRWLLDLLWNGRFLDLVAHSFLHTHWNAL
jgi:hypothetical protein